MAISETSLSFFLSFLIVSAYKSLNHHETPAGKPSQGFSRAWVHPEGEDLRWGRNITSTHFQIEHTADRGVLRPKQFIKPEKK